MRFINQRDIREELRNKTYEECEEELDANYDATGKRLDRLEQINSVMIGLFMRIDQPELASYFTTQLTTNKAKVEVFADALGLKTVASFTVAEQLQEIKDTRETKEFVRLLVLEIRHDVTNSGNLLIDSIKDVLTLTNDTLIFRGPYKQSVRIELIKALEESGNRDLAIEVAKLCGLTEISDIRYLKHIEEDSKEKQSFIQRRRARKVGKSALKSLSASLNRDGVNVVPKKEDDTNYDMYNRHSHLFGFLFLGDEKSAKEYKSFVRSFNVPWFQNRKLSEAELDDRTFQSLIADEKLSSLTQLEAAAIMTAKFSNTPETQLDLEAHILTELDDVSASASTYETVVGVVERSVYSQELNDRILELREKIENLNNLSLRAKYAMRLRDASGTLTKMTNN